MDQFPGVEGLQDVEELGIPEAVTALATAAKNYVSAVDALRGPLEADIRAAVEACWDIVEKQVQLKGKPFMRKKIKLRDAEFRADGEEFLSRALQQWQSAAEGAVGSAALEVRIAERRLLYAIDRLTNEMDHPPALYLSLLHLLLTAVESMGAPTMISCPTTFQLIRNLALYIGCSLMELEGDEVELYRGLVDVLQQHVASCDWALALLHPPIKLLPCLVQHIAHSKGMGQASDSGEMECRSRVLLLEQLPWQQLDVLQQQQLKEEVLPPLLELLDGCAGSLVAGNEDAEELLCRVCCMVASASEQVSGGDVSVHTELMLAILAVACGTTVTGLLSRHDGLCEGEVLHRRAVWLAWHEVCWGNSCAAGAGAAERLVQKLAWQDMAGQVPGQLVALVFLSIAQGLRHGTEMQLQRYNDWLVSFLDSRVGRPLMSVGRGADGSVDIAGAVEVCTAQPPSGADSTVLCLWSMQCVKLVLSLLEHEACSAAVTLDVDDLMHRSNFCGMLEHIMNSRESSKHSMVTATVAQAVKWLAQLPSDVVWPHIGPLCQVWMMCVMGADVSDSVSDGACRVVQRQMYELMVDNLSASSAKSPDHHFVHAATLWLSLFVKVTSLTTPHHLLLKLMNDITQLLYYYHPTIGVDGTNSFLAATVRALGRAMAGKVQGKLFSAVGEETVELQWLAVLACWLYNFTTLLSVPPPSAHDHAPAASVTASSSLDDTMDAVGESQLQQCSSVFQQVITLADHVPTDNFALDEDEGDDDEPQQPLTEATPTKGSAPEAAAGEAGCVTPEPVPARAESGLDGSPSIRNEEQMALRIQDVAIALKRGGACVPLWEELLVLYSNNVDKVRPLILRDDVCRALAVLAELYQMNSPLLSDICTRWAPLNVDALEGRVRLLSSNQEAVHELMMTHPLRVGPANLTRLLPKDPPSHSDSHPPTPQITYPRRPRVTSDTFANFLLQQADVAEDLRDVMAVMHFWTLRAEKQLARPMSTQCEDDIDGDLFDPELHMADGQGEGDIPDIIAQAQAKLWDCTTSWSAELTSICQQLQNIVQLRYSKIYPELLDGDRFMPADVVETPEAPNYDLSLQANREKAMNSIMHFSEGEGLTSAAAAMHQLEVLLLHAHMHAKEGQPDKNTQDVIVEDREVDLKCQLMTVIARVILDGSSPPICLPFFHQLYSQAAAGIVPLNLKTKLRIVRCILQSLSQIPGSDAPSRQDAAVLFKSLLDPQALIESSRLDDFFSCLKTVIRHCPRNSGPAMSHILRAFDAVRYVAACSESGALDVKEGAVHIGGDSTAAGSEGSAWGSSAGGQAPKAATQLLSLAMEALETDGATSTACDLVEGVVCSCPPRYFGAAVHCAVAGPTGSSRAAVLRVLMKVPHEVLPLEVLLEACVQISDALNANRMTTDDIPNEFLQLLLSAPTLWAAVKDNMKGIQPKGGQDTTSFFTATTQLPGRNGPAGGAAPSASPSSPRGFVTGFQPPPLVLLPVQSALPPLVVLREIIGALLQSMVRKYGGAAGEGLAENLAQVLMLLFEPVSTNPQLVDWVWNLYKEQLQPFLELAVPSDSGAVMRFRECWLSLPWHTARFMVDSPQALAEFGGYLLSKDHAAADLLPLLNWDPVLRRLAPIRNNPEARHSPEVVSWATEFSLFALQACVLLQREDLPPFLTSILWKEGVDPNAGGVSQPVTPRTSEPSGLEGLAPEDVLGPELGEPMESPRKLSLTDILAAADWRRLECVMTQTVGGSPWLLQPLVLSPSVVSGPPGYRIVHALRLIKSGAEATGEAQAAKVAAAVSQSVMFVSLVHVPGGQGVEMTHVLRGMSGVGECWHLSTDEHEELVCGVLLPLAMLHSSFELAESGFTRDDDLPVSCPASPALPINGSGDLNTSPTAPTDLFGATLSQPEMLEAAPVASLIAVLRAKAIMVTVPEALPFANAAAPLQPGGPQGEGEMLVVYADVVQAQLAEMILESCKRGPLYWPPCLLRVSWVSSSLRSSVEVMNLMEAVLHLLLLRLIHKGPSTPTRIMSHDRFTRSPPGSYEDGERVFLQPVLADAPHTEDDTSQDEASSALHLKTLDNLTLHQLQAIIETAVLGACPLIATLCLESLRQHAIRAEVDTWERYATIALRHATAMPLPKELPEHIVSVWLEVLFWLADSRCQGVTSEEWLQLLADFLNTLNLHVRKVQVAEGLVFNNESNGVSTGSVGSVAVAADGANNSLAAKLDPANVRGQFAKIGTFFGRTIRGGVDAMPANGVDAPAPTPPAPQQAPPRSNPFAQFGSRIRQRMNSTGGGRQDDMRLTTPLNTEAESTGEGAGGRARGKMWTPFGHNAGRHPEEPMSPPNEFQDPFAAAVVQEVPPLASQLSPRLHGLVTQVSHRERLEEQSSGAILSAEASDEDEAEVDVGHSQQESLMSPSRISRSHSVTLSSGLTPRSKSDTTPSPVQPLGFIGHLRQLPKRLNINRQQEQNPSPRPKASSVSSEGGAHIRVAAAACLIGYHMQMVLCPWLDSRINPDTFAHFDTHMLMELLNVPNAAAVANNTNLITIMETDMTLEDFQSSLQHALFPHAAYLMQLGSSRG